MDPNAAIFATAALICLAALAGPLARATRVPEVVWVALCGVLLGLWAELSPPDAEGGGAAAALRALDAPSDWLLGILLPIVLFQGAASLDARALAREGAAIAFLAVGAVLLAVAALAPAAVALLGIGWGAAVLLAAIVATTDPSAVLALFREAGAPARLTRWIEGESLLNDATALAIFSAAVTALVAGTEPSVLGFAADMAEMLGMGMGFGWVAGAILARAMFALGESQRGTRWAWVVAAPLAVHAGAALLPGVSSLVAVVAAGLAFGARTRARMAPADRAETASLLGAVAHSAGLAILVVGSVMAPAVLLAAPWTHAVAGAVLACVALVVRALTLWWAMPGLARLAGFDKLPHAQTVLVAFGGLRGAMTLALAFAVWESQILSEETREAIAAPAIAFAFTTLFVQAPLLRPLMRALGLLEGTDADRLHRRLLGDEIADRARLTAEAFVRDAGLPMPAAWNITGGDVVQDRASLRAALQALAARERAMYVENRAAWGLAPAAIERRINALEEAAEQAMEGGRRAYLDALDPVRSPSWWQRMAARAFRWGWSAPLGWLLEEEIAGLVAEATVVTRLRSELSVWTPTLGERGAAILDEILAERARRVREARAAWRARHPAFVSALEERLGVQALRAAQTAAVADAAARDLAPSALLAGLEREVRRPMPSLPRPRPDKDPTLGERLLAHPLLRGLPEADAKTLAGLVKVHAFASGEQLLGPKGTPSWVWIIESGVVDTERFDHKVRLGAGSAVGHLRLLHNHSGAPSTARGPVEALALPAAAVRAMARRHPQWAMALEEQARSEFAREE